MDLIPLCERLRLVVGAASYRQIGEVTATHPETVRRYMQGQSPSVEFIAAVCHHYHVNGEWVLTGQGPMRRADLKAHALKLANPSDLLGAVATGLERTGERLDRLERFLHTMETRLRAGEAAPAAATATPADVEVKPEAGAEAEAPSRARSPRIPVVGTVSGPDATVRTRATPGRERTRAMNVADALPSPRPPTPGNNQQ